MICKSSYIFAKGLCTVDSMEGLAISILNNSTHLQEGKPNDVKSIYTLPPSVLIQTLAQA